MPLSCNQSIVIHNWQRYPLEIQEVQGGKQTGCCETWKMKFQCSRRDMTLRSLLAPCANLLAEDDRLEGLKENTTMLNLML